MSLTARRVGTLARTKGWDARRLFAGIVLASWASLFWFLMAAERTALFLSSRTDWVVPVGAVILTIAAVGRLLTARTETPELLPRKEAIVLAALIVPAVLIATLPPASLGSYAAARRSSIVGGGFISAPGDIRTGELTLLTVGGALRDPESMAALRERAGEKVNFIGFVDRDDTTPASEFTLTRFVVSCCVADALGVQVRVVGAPPGRFKDDQWVNVTGSLYPLEDQIVVDASEITAIERPKQPYLSP
ncbi:MAG: TIGR03943 family putative permease subunit [Actinomycetota bacterium]